MSESEHRGKNTDTAAHKAQLDPNQSVRGRVGGKLPAGVSAAQRAGHAPHPQPAQPASQPQPTQSHTQPQPHHHGHALASILGPAFVAAVAYVDPGNVAANITSGARYGYLLVWVLVLANLMSVLIQYQSAKLGIVTGKSLPQILGERMSDAGRYMFFMQA